jgi:phosphatidylglycerophosphate synthase
MTDLKNRRPLSSRNTKWASRIANALVARDITPNQISQSSIAAATVAGGAFWATSLTSGIFANGCLLVVAALACQLRLLCNLFDGMVAIEAGKSAADGPFWNEFPDRVSDIVIFSGVGFGIGSPALGFAAATMAVLTAYTRELGAGVGLAPNFCGPMAKQHRMALISIAAILAASEPYWLPRGTILDLSLWLIIVGAIATSARRARQICNELLQR